MLFVIFSWPKSCGERIERNASGDVFERGYYSLLRDDGWKIDCDDVDGEGTGSASSKNNTHCRCGSGQTFYFDNVIDEPKCMKKYGQSSRDLRELYFSLLL